MMRFLLPCLVLHAAPALAQDNRSLLIGEWACEIDYAFGPGTAAISYFASGDTSIAAIIRVDGTPMVITLYGAGVWLLDGNTLTEIAASIHVLGIEGVPEGMAAALEQEMKANVNAQSTSVSTITRIDQTYLTILSPEGETSTCTRI